MADDNGALEGDAKIFASMEDTMGQAYDSISDGDDGGAPAESGTDGGGQIRDESGRFASKEQNTNDAKPGDADAAPDGEQDQEAQADAPASDDGESDAAAEEETTQDEDTPADDDSAQALEPHPRWSEEMKARFATLPRDAQEVLLNREREIERAFTQKTQELSQERQRYQQFDEVLAPLRTDQARQALQGAGVSEAGYVQALIEADRALQTDPKTALRRFADQAGIDLAELAASSDEPDQSQQAPSDPRVDELLQVVPRLKRTIDEMRGQSEAAQTKAVVDEITAFATETDEKGAPLRPHWDELGDELMAHVQAVRANNPDMPNREVLQTAYDKAVWASESTRAKVLEQRDAERKAKAAENAKKAKRAAAVNVGGKSPGAMKDAPRSIDETIEAAYEKATRGAA